MKDPQLDRAHVSKHFVQGKEGTHAIAQQIHHEGRVLIAYTDVSHEGDVGQSGFDAKR
jgi:hypothetical protein